MQRIDSCRPNVDEYAGKEVNKGAPLPPPLKRMRLNADCAPKLLRLLSDRGIDATSLFPGFDGVAQALKDRRLFD